MQGVRRVDGEHGGARQGAEELLAVAAARQDDALEHVAQERRVRALRRAAPDFLVVGEERDGGLRGGFGGGEGAEQGVRRQQVVEPWRTEEILPQSENACFPLLDEGDVRGGEVVVRQTGLTGDGLAEFTEGDVAEEGPQMLLGIVDVAVVDFAVQVNGQVGNDGERLWEREEMLLSVRRDDASRQRQRLVQPAAVDGLRIALDGNDQHAAPLGGRVQLQPQSWAVQMRQHQAEGVRLALPPGDDGTAVAADQVASAWSQAPVFLL